jgi:hypothetical protein
MTSRSSRATITGLRRLVREKNVPPKLRLKAIEMLCQLEGLYDSNGKSRQSPAKEANASKLRLLLEPSKDFAQQ